MKKIFLIGTKCIMALAVVVTTFNVNSTCMFFINQPKVPESAKGLRKF